MTMEGGTGETCVQVTGVNDLPVEVLSRCIAMAVGQRCGPMLTLATVNRAFMMATHQAMELVNTIQLTFHDLNVLEHYLHVQSDDDLMLKYVLGLIERAKKVERLDFTAGHMFVTDFSLSAILALCQNRLSYLNVNDCPLLTDKGLSSISALQPGLRELHLQRSETKGIGLAAFGCLEVLDISWCQDLDSAALCALLPRLRRLVMKGYEDATDDMMRFLGNCEFLDITCTGIGDDGLRLLGEFAPKLKQLVIGMATFNIWPPVSWTRTALDALQRRRPKLLITMSAC